MRASGRKPTRRQMDAITAARLNPSNWLVVKAHGGRLEIKHRQTGNKREIGA